MSPSTLKATISQLLEAHSIKTFTWFLGGYIALHFLLRVIFSPVIGTDDVTQAIHAQTLALGYEFRQPPLYTWLQWGVNQLIGVSVYSHIFLKYLLLFVTYFFLYRIGRIVLSRHSTAVLASLSLWLTFPFAVSIHQGVTHSVLLCALIAVSVFSFLKLERKRSLLGYIGLGVWLGLGIFSKYGFLFFVLALMLAALSLMRFRSVVLDRRILVTLLMVVLISIPPVLWMIEEQAGITKAVTALGSKQDKLVAVHPYLSNLGSLLSAIVQFLSPLWLLLLVFFPRVFRSAQVGDTPPNNLEYMQLLGRVIAIGLGMIVLAMLLGVLGKVQPRWMHAFLLLFPLYFFIRAEHAYPQGVAKRGYLLVLALVPILGIALWAAQTYVGPSVKKATRFHAPYPELIKHLREQQITPGLIIAQDEYLAGNLRLGFSDAAVITPSFPYRPALKRNGSCLLVWLTSNRKENAAGTALTPAIRPFMVNPDSIRLEDIQVWKQPYRYSNRTFLEVAYLSLPMTACKANAPGS